MLCFQTRIAERTWETEGSRGRSIETLDAKWNGTWYTYENPDWLIKLQNLNYFTCVSSWLLGTSNERTSSTERRDELFVQNWQCWGAYQTDKRKKQIPRLKRCINCWLVDLIVELQAATAIQRRLDPDLPMWTGVSEAMTLKCCNQALMGFRFNILSRSKPRTAC